MTPRPYPVVGLTTSRILSEQEERPLRVGQNQSYVNAVIRAGAAPLLIPFVTDSDRLRLLYDCVDGLLLPGGGDVDPAHYGEACHAKTDDICPERDEVELTLARWAMGEGKPLLAICRGIQVLNVALGGSLFQDIADQVPGAGKHDWYPGYPRDHRPHTVAVAPGSRLAQILGASELAVNSLHHQALNRVALGLTVVARAPDGIVESVEAPDHPFALAVQWHPEELTPADLGAQAIFDAFVMACR